MELQSSPPVGVARERESKERIEEKERGWLTGDLSPRGIHVIKTPNKTDEWSILTVLRVEWLRMSEFRIILSNSDVVDSLIVQNIFSIYF